MRAFFSLVEIVKEGFQLQRRPATRQELCNAPIETASVHDKLAGHGVGNSGGVAVFS